MRCIMAGMDQKYGYVGVAWWICACCVQQQVLPVSKCRKLWFSAVAFLHHGRRHLLRGSEAHPHGPCDHGDSPVVRGSGDRCPCWWYDGAETVVFRSCSSSMIVDFLFVPQRQLPMVPPFRKTIEFLLLQYVDWWSMPLFCRSFSMPVVV